ncbi:MAG TPA: GtrA family protein [Lacibacter sp.]|nr:GtrA family protein [Lacibacter sp.]
MVRKYIHLLLKFFYPVIKKLIPFEVYAYLTVGAVNTILNIGLFMLLYLMFSNTVLAVETATFISFFVTVLTGFWLQKNFAFTTAGNEKSDTRQQFMKYALVALQGQLSAYLLTKGMILLLHINASAAYVITSIIMLTLNYFLQKYFTFKKRRTIVS